MFLYGFTFRFTALRLYAQKASYNLGAEIPLLVYFVLVQRISQ